MPGIFDCLGSAAITPVSPQPINSATCPPAMAALTSPKEKLSALGGASLDGLDVLLEPAHPARVVELRVHRVRIEEHRARVVGMVGVGGGVAEEEPELLAAAAERLGRAPQALVGPGEELGDVEIFLPGLGRRQVVAVLGLERLLLLRVLEQVDAVGGGVQVAVHGLRQHLAVPHHQPLAVDRVDVLPVRALLHRRRHLGQVTA